PALRRRGAWPQGRLHEDDDEHRRGSHRAHPLLRARRVSRDLHRAVHQPRIQAIHPHRQDGEGPVTDLPRCGRRGGVLPAMHVGPVRGRDTMLRTCILGTGIATGEHLIKNEQLAKMMDTSDEWIRERSGVEERYYVDTG